VEEISSSSDHRRATNLFHVDVSRSMRWLLCGRHLHSPSVVGARLCRKFLGKSHVGWQGSWTKRSFSSVSHAGKFCKSWVATRIKNAVLIFAGSHLCCCLPPCFHLLCLAELHTKCCLEHRAECRLKHPHAIWHASLDSQWWGSS
jgi:hypothetical protein